MPQERNKPSSPPRLSRGESSHSNQITRQRIRALSPILTPQHGKFSLQRETDISYEKLALEKGLWPLGIAIQF